MKIEDIRNAHKKVMEFDNLVRLYDIIETDVVNGAPNYDGYIHRHGDSFRINVDGMYIRPDKEFMDFLTGWINGKIRTIKAEIEKL